MFDFTNYGQDDFVLTTAPISMELLLAYNSAKQQEQKYGFMIDYAGSSLKGKTLLNYLANMEVPFALQFTQEVTLEERFDLIRTYMELPVVVECPSLAMAAANILLELKDVNEPYMPGSILSSEQSIDFIEANVDLVSRWAIVMDSMLVYLLTHHQIYVDAFGETKDAYPRIDDPRAVGKNFVNLLGITPFMELYFTEPGESLYYFERQFEDPIYSSKPLSYFFTDPKNPLPMLLNTLGDDSYDLTKAEEELDSL